MTRRLRRRYGRARARSKWAGKLSGGYDRDADAAENALAALHEATNSVQNALAESRAKLAARPGHLGTSMDVKRIMTGPYSKLKSAIESARITYRASKLPALPRHGGFAEAHALYETLGRRIEAADALRQRVSRATYGDVGQVTAAVMAA